MINRPIREVTNGLQIHTIIFIWREGERKGDDSFVYWDILMILLDDRMTMIAFKSTSGLQKNSPEYLFM